MTELVTSKDIAKLIGISTENVLRVARDTPEFPKIAQQKKQPGAGGRMQFFWNKSEVEQFFKTYKYRPRSSGLTYKRVQQSSTGLDNNLAHLFLTGKLHAEPKPAAPAKTVRIHALGDCQ